MKNTLALMMALSVLLLFAACGHAEEPTLAGGWTLTEDGAFDEEVKTVFDKALEGLIGVDYTPLALLGTQLVSGTNYSFLCESTVVYPDAETTYVIVTVHAGLDGAAELTDIFTMPAAD